MRAFEYASPQTKEDAVQILQEAQGKATVLAGGTDLLSLMKDDIVSPRRLVDIKTISDLQGVSYDSSLGLRMGALVTLDQLLGDDKIRQEYPSIWQAAEGVRSPQVRARGTVGGDLCQRPRCWYYRNGFGLLALRNNKSMVVEGDNRYHAVLGNDGPAYFVNPSSLAPALIAFGAKVRIFGPSGPREVSLQGFYVIPKQEGQKENSVGAEEILTEVLVPPASNRTNATYEVRQKEALDWPLATASVALEMEGGKIKSAQAVMGHVAPIPWRASAAERALIGRTISEDTAEAAGKAAMKGAKALSRNQYKIQLAQVAIKRAVLRTTGAEV